MSQKPPTVSLMIMGKEYKITCDPEEQEELIYSAQKLDQQMRKCVTQVRLRAQTELR